MDDIIAEMLTEIDDLGPSELMIQGHSIRLFSEKWTNR